MKILILTEKEVNEKLDRLYAEVRRAHFDGDHHATDFIDGQILTWRKIKSEMTEIVDINL